METDDVRGVCPPDGGSDEPGRGTTDNVAESEKPSNVIQIADFTQSGTSLDVEVLSRETDPGYIQHQIREELERLQGLKYAFTDEEHESYIELANNDWFKTCSPRVKLSVLQYPPFYLYRLKSTGHYAGIKSYEEAKPKYRDRYAQGKITCTVMLEKKWNADLLSERMIRFCPLEDLERLKHRLIAERDKWISRGAV